jgi:hypothetical protein
MCWKQSIRCSRPSSHNTSRNQFAQIINQSQLLLSSSSSSTTTTPNNSIPIGHFHNVQELVRNWSVTQQQQQISIEQSFDGIVLRNDSLLISFVCLDDWRIVSIDVKSATASNSNNVCIAIRQQLQNLLLLERQQNMEPQRIFQSILVSLRYFFLIIVFVE